MTGNDMWFSSDDGDEYSLPAERTMKLDINILEYSENSPTTVIKQFTDDNSRWPDLLETFIRALEAHFGYSIMERIFIQENGSPYGLEGWPGGVIKLDSE